MFVMYIFASMPRLHEVDDADDDEEMNQQNIVSFSVTSVISP